MAHATPIYCQLSGHYHPKQPLQCHQLHFYAHKRKSDYVYPIQMKGKSLEEKGEEREYFSSLP